MGNAASDPFGDGDGAPDRSMFATKSAAAQRREDAAKSAFFAALRTDAATTFEIPAKTHLTEACFKEFRKLVRSHEGCTVSRREATPRERAASGDKRQGRLWVISVHVTREAQRTFSEGDRTAAGGGGSSAAAAAPTNDSGRLPNDGSAPEPQSQRASATPPGGADGDASGATPPRKKRKGPVLFHGVGTSVCGTSRSADDEPPLLSALDRCAYDTATLSSLIAGGADVNAADRRGRTPLSVALRGPVLSRAAVTRLLEAGADPDARDATGTPPLCLAAVAFSGADSALVSQSTSDGLFVSRASSRLKPDLHLTPVVDRAASFRSMPPPLAMTSDVARRRTRTAGSSPRR
jgi:hypothetical protein